MSSVTLHPGDNRASLAGMPDNSVDSVCCDPPYGLVSIQKRFGKEGAAPARKEKNDGSFARLSGGFMGRKWDGTGIENDPSFWAEVLRVLKPGGYIVAFSSSRTYHRMACAIEDAGFITHPMIGWCYGQGFPKAHAADKAIDKMLGKQGKIVPAGDPVKRMIPGADQHKDGSWIKDNGREYQPGAYVPATDEAAAWQGWAYGGQVRKPALEPIFVGQKPFSTKSGAENILKWGVGAVNIDGCRVSTQDETSRPQGRDIRGGQWGGGVIRKQSCIVTGGHEIGRHPANLIHDGSAEVVALFPESAGQQGAVRGDSGSAARFFESYPFDGEPLFYQPKAGKEDRAPQFLNEGQQGHPTVKPIALMQALVRHVTPPGGTVLDPFAGSGTTGEAALREGFDCILMEAEPEYIGFLERRFGLKEASDDGLSLYMKLLGVQR